MDPCLVNSARRSFVMFRNVAAASGSRVVFKYFSNSCLHNVSLPLKQCTGFLAPVKDFCGERLVLTFPSLMVDFRNECS